MCQKSITIVVAATLAVAAAQSSSSLPIVDLGYEVHKASLESTSGSYNFSNIRFAEPPVGDLRFRAPVPAAGKNRTVNDGSVGRICPQANPAWEAVASSFITDYLSGQPFNLSASTANSSRMASSLPPQDSRTTEDCLFLDVVVPQQIYSSAANTTANRTGGAPVLVWIYGGGFTTGEKSSHNAAGLIKASQVNDTQGVIFVSLNYRLGAFGWLGGPTFQSDGTVNAGLYDQRLALQWVQQNIHLFGGDPNRVTVIGESSGAGSIMYQITAFGGLQGSAPFQQAILQSPAFPITLSNLQGEQIFNNYLSLLKVTTIEEARQLPYQVLQLANILQVAKSPYGQFTWGPVVDGLFAPAIPGKLLLDDQFDHSLNIMVGHNADEGLFSASPAVTNDTSYDAYLKTLFPTISSNVTNYVETVLYPPPPLSGVLGTTGYNDETGRVDLTVSEAIFTCNTYYLDLAFQNRTHGYQFSAPPALHGQDVPYTFFNGPNSLVISDLTAIALQEYITSFAIKGTPSGPQLPLFPLYGNGSQIVDLGAQSITEIMDPVANERCRWWQKGLYV